MVTRAVAARKTAIAINQWDVSNVFHDYKFKRDAAEIDITTFGGMTTDHLAGIQKSDLDLKGFYSYGPGSIDQIVAELFGQDDPALVALAPAGWGPRKPVLLVPSVLVTYDLAGKTKDATTVDVKFAPRGAVDGGIILAAPTLPLSGTGISVSLDPGPASAGPGFAGASAHLHVFGLSGTSPSLAVKIQYSIDAIVWTDLAAFDAVTSPTAQRIVLPPGTVVNPYARASYALTGTANPSATALIAFARAVAYP